MFARTQTHPHPELEILKWLALLILAGAIALLLTGQLAGDITAVKAVPEPGSIPPPAVVRPDVHALPSAEAAEDHFATAALVWQAMQEQRAGEAARALALWNQVQLPPPTDVWRKVAIAMAELQLTDTQQAEQTLLAARNEAPQNALVHYVIGILRLTQSESADEWYDASGLDPTRLAAAPAEESTHTRTMYELAAMMALERAVLYAPQVCSDEPLLPDEWTRSPDFEVTMPLATPLVQDLLEALGIEAYEGRSHLVLGDLHRMRGSLEHAEEHLDQAAHAGIPTGEAYQHLGSAYEQQGMSAEAARAYLKAMSHGPAVAAPALKALENLRNALRSL
jgi:tetratricopeptide (TPR) repeat protein